MHCYTCMLSLLCRFVAAGGFEKFVTKKASVFRFDTEYGLDRTLVSVSMHYFQGAMLCVHHKIL